MITVSQYVFLKYHAHEKYFILSLFLRISIFKYLFLF